jgi:hypothetical protein
VDDESLKPVYERLEELEGSIAALQQQITHLKVDRHWTDEISSILNWAERNRRSLFYSVAMVGAIALVFNVSTDERDKAFARFTTPEAVCSLLLAISGATVAATKKGKD